MRSRVTRLIDGLLVATALVAIGACDATTPSASRRAGTEATTQATRLATPPTTEAPRPAPDPPPCVAAPTLAQPALPPPAALAAGLGTFLADERVVARSVGVSVWIDGFGEVLTHDPDLALAPASNQKLFTAMSALAVLGSDTRLTTRLVVASTGELVIVGGGDPTLTATGPHSVAALADQALANGVAGAAGLLVDETRHDGARRAAGWQDWQIPTYTGPMSALMVDDNRWRADPAFLADPAIGNADLLRDALQARGVMITGQATYAQAIVPGRTVASLVSPTLAELVTEMLLRSDNQIADLLMKEVGALSGGAGSIEHGAAVGNASLASLCVPLVGRTDDGSGLSRGNARSAREWRMLLQAANGAPWSQQLIAALPVAAESGTLSSRFGGTVAAGKVRAKTGTIIGGSALSGYATTASGRAVVFSVVVNGPNGENAARAIDELVASIVADSS